MKYVSGRVKELKVGITSHTENKTPFSVIGNADITGDIISGGLVGIGSLIVAGVSTFTGAIDANGDLDVDGHTELDNVNVSGVSTLTGIVTTGSDLYVGGDLYVNDDLVLDNITGNSLKITGLSTFGGTIDANGDLDVDGHTELDNLNVSGIATFTDVIDSNGQIVGAATSNIVPFLYSNYSLFPSATTYHGAVAHAHNTGKLYYAHGGNWIELVNKETNGTVGTGTEKYDIGITSVTSLYVSGISTYDGNLDVQSSVLITGITTVSGALDINAGGQANTFKVEDLTDNRVVIAGTGGELEDDANLTFNGSTFNVGSAITMYQATGIISATAFYGDGSGLDNTGATLSASSGIQRLVLTSLTSGTMTSAATDADLSFDATTNLLSAQKLFVSGISTFTGQTKFNGNVVLGNDSATDIISVEARFDDDLVPVSTGDKDLGVSNRRWRTLFVKSIVQGGGGISTFTNDIDLNGDLDVDGHTNLDDISVAGVSTFSNSVGINSNLNVTGVSTFSANAGPTTIEPGLVTISPQGANHAQLTINSTESSTTAGPVINLVRDDGAPTTNDYLGIIKFNGSNSVGAQLDYLKLSGKILDVTSTSEDAALEIKHYKAGSETVTSEFRSDGLYLLNDSFLNVTGVSTFSKPVGITSDLQVTGTTRLDGIVSSNNSLITVDKDTWFKSSNGIRVTTSASGDSHRLRLKGTGTSAQVEGIALQLNTNFDGGTTQHAFTSGYNTSTKIYHLGNQKLETTTHGVVVTGIATADGAVVGDLTSGRVVLAGTSGRIEDSSKVTFNGSTLAVVGDANFTGNVTVQGTLTSEDKTNIDSIGIVTARTGVRISAGGLVVTSGVSTFTDAIDSNGDVNISGTLNANSHINLGNGASDTISAAGRFDTDVIPSSDGAKDLGLDAVRWRNLYADVLHGDGSQLTGITAAGTGAIGGLTVKDEGVTVGTAGSVSTFDFRGATVTAIANTGAAGIATITVTTEQNQNIQTLNVTGISTFNGNINVISTDAGSSAAPEFKLYRNSATPANADYLGQIKFAGESSTGVERNYAKITGKILDSSNGAEDGILEFAHIKNGSQVITGRWRSDSLQLLNGTSLTVAGDVSATNFNSTSDARLKTNVQTITSPLDKINQIDGVTFEWIADNKPSVGVIADTVEKVFPELIGQTLEVSDKDETRYKTVNYDGLIGLLIEAVKEQQVQITELKTKLDSLS